jgi:hypothetical protein
MAGSDPLPPPPPTPDLVGLALSGDGIRSATFALGALPALDAHRHSRRVRVRPLPRGPDARGPLGGRRKLGFDTVRRAIDAVGPAFIPPPGPLSPAVIGRFYQELLRQHR